MKTQIDVLNELPVFLDDFLSRQSFPMSTNRSDIHEMIAEGTLSTDNHVLQIGIRDNKEIGGNFGFAFMQVRPNLNKNVAKKEVDVKIVINKSQKIYVQRINIKGNSRTKDKVLRREMRFNEGDAFSNEKLKRSEQRIRNTGFFESVESESKPAKKPDRTNLFSFSLP